MPIAMKIHRVRYWSKNDNFFLSAAGAQVLTLIIFWIEWFLKSGSNCLAFGPVFQVFCLADKCLNGGFYFISYFTRFF